MAGIRACVFDAYGTLFDVHSAVGASARPGRRAGRRPVPAVARQAARVHLAARADGRHADFWQVTGDALDYALARTGVDPALREPLMQAYLALDAYPEVPETLRRLRAGGLKTALLSNGEPGMLAAGARSAGIDGLLDAILSVEEVGVFKPHPKVYQLAVDRLGVPTGSDRLPVVERLGRERRRRPLACARYGSTGSACRRSACPAWPSTSFGICRDCRRCSACERTGRRATVARLVNEADRQLR